MAGPMEDMGKVPLMEEALNEVNEATNSGPATREHDLAALEAMEGEMKEKGIPFVNLAKETSWTCPACGRADSVDPDPSMN